MNNFKNNQFYVGFEELSTIRDFYRYALSQANAHQCFSGHGSEDLFDDLWVLISASLKIPHSQAQYFLDAKLTRSEKSELTELLAKRILDGIPVAYLINKAYSHGLEFYVDERVLIPRSPIAELINKQFYPWISEAQVHNILDLCTGSGCLAINACLEFPNAKVTAVDISRDALEVAKINQKKYQLHNQLTLIESDLWQNVPQKQYDVILSNPPYVAKNIMQQLPREYINEPNIALEAADDGLAIVVRILNNAKDYLSNDGILIVEVGCAMAALLNRYPTLPFTMLDFEHGGEDVFLLTKEQICKFF